MSADVAVARPKRRRPRTLRVTREGRVFLLVTVGVGVAAVNTGNNLLYLVLGLLLSLIVLSGILSESVLRGVRVTRRLPRRVVARAPALVELTLTNVKRRVPSYSIELEDVVSGASVRRCRFLKVRAGEERVAAYPLTAARRGRLAFSEVVVRTRFPFAIFEKARRIALEDELVVFPALTPPPRRPFREGSLGAEVAAPRRGAGAEIAGLREYTSGDEARAIHWLRTASLGRVVVRERRADAARWITLLLDESRPDGAGEAHDLALEETIEAIAGIAARALDEGAGVEVVARGGASPRLSAGQPPDPILRFLALLEPVDARDAPALPSPRGEVERYVPAPSASEERVS